MTIRKKRVIYVVVEYPQLSQTYIANEIEALRGDHEIEVITTREPETPYRSAVPYSVCANLGAAIEKVQDFKPDILHGHWLHTVSPLDILSRKTGVPYTVRAHSFDALLDAPELSPVNRVKNYLRARYRFSVVWAPNMARHASPFVNRENCLGVLCFPFSTDWLKSHGFPEDKLRPVYPVVNFQRFYNTDPNGDGVMNIGACIPKKRIETYIDLAHSLPARKFRLYPIGYETEKMHALNQKMGSPVEFMPTREPREMPSEYKRHQWMVYTGALDTKSDLGWSMAVAEAQASGVGVCYPNIRPDIAEYVGGAGIVYSSLDEVREIIKDPVPDEIRRKGFEQAKKSDIFVHKKVLTDIWDNAA